MTTEQSQASQLVRGASVAMWVNSLLETIKEKAPKSPSVKPHQGLDERPSHLAIFTSALPTWEPLADGSSQGTTTRGFHALRRD